MMDILKIGTRGSPLAMTQTRHVQSLLAKAWPDLNTEIIVIKTSGDWKPSDGETRLSDVDGGKGLFTKEIELALMDGRIDCAVHSMKDVETFMPDGLAIAAILQREDPRDAMIFRPGLSPCSIEELPPNAVIGTASVRRGAFTLAKRPDISIIPLRGNVDTRLEKLKSGACDVTFLAMAGLNRLGIAHKADRVLEINEMLPSSAQGAVGIQIKEGHSQAHAALQPLNHADTSFCVHAERAVLAILDGSCHTPIGALARIDGDIMHLRASLAALDGSQIFEKEHKAPVKNIDEAIMLGQKVGAMIKDIAPPHLLEQYAYDER